jgi:hypothetical protein
MKFNSKSVLLNRGENLKCKITIPKALQSYEIPDEIWDASINKFNNELDARHQVSEIIKDIKVDVLRIHHLMGDLILWMAVKANDASTIESLQFTLKGKLVFENDTTKNLESIIIEDLLYGSPDGEKQSIFKKELTY